MTMASTFWAMNARTALSLLFFLALGIGEFRSIPSFFAPACMSFEKAGRQSPSSPTCEKPMVTAQVGANAKRGVSAQLPGGLNVPEKRQFLNT